MATEIVDERSIALAACQFILRAEPSAKFWKGFPVRTSNLANSPVDFCNILASFGQTRMMAKKGAPWL
jgi:hypothetical protein